MHRVDAYLRVRGSCGCDGGANGVKLFDVLYVGDDMTHTER